MQGDVAADFHLAIGDGKRVVENGRVGEIAHAEAVQPLQRAGLTLVAGLIFDANLAGEHPAILIPDAVTARSSYRSLPRVAAERRTWSQKRRFTFRGKLQPPPVAPLYGLCERQFLAFSMLPGPLNQVLDLLPL